MNSREIYVVVPSNDINSTVEKLRSLGLNYRVASQDWLNSLSLVKPSAQPYRSIYSNLVSNTDSAAASEVKSEVKNEVNNTSTEMGSVISRVRSSSCSCSSRSSTPTSSASSSDEDAVVKETIVVEKINEDQRSVQPQPVRMINQEVIIDRNTTSRSLGESGEEEMFNMLVSLFPKMEVKLISKTPHVGDIHVVDYKSKTLFLFEIKNKRYLSAEDVNKFKRDIENVKSIEQSNSSSGMRVVGVFISLVSPVPSYGTLYIDSAMAIVGGAENVTPSAIAVLIETYTRLNKQLLRVEEQREIVKFVLPDNAYPIIAQLTVQLSTADREIKEYEDELAMIDKMRVNLCSHIQAARTRTAFYQMLKREFPDVRDEDNDERLLIDEELRFREWLRNNKKATKRRMYDEFPQLENKLRAMTIESIHRNYSTNE